MPWRRERIFAYLDLVPEITSMLVMVQKEVAERFFAWPSTKAYGSVSVLVQLTAERTGYHPVSREVFRPPPNVESALVAFQRIGPGPSKQLKKVVEGAFSHRRKTLANSLSLSGIVSREKAAERAQDMTVFNQLLMSAQ